MSYYSLIAVLSTCANCVLVRKPLKVSMSSRPFSISILTESVISLMFRFLISSVLILLCRINLDYFYWSIFLYCILFQCIILLKILFPVSISAFSIKKKHHVCIEVGNNAWVFNLTPLKNKSHFMPIIFFLSLSLCRKI